MTTLLDNDPYTSETNSDDGDGYAPAPTPPTATMQLLLDQVRKVGGKPMFDDQTGTWLLPCPYHPQGVTEVRAALRDGGDEIWGTIIGENVGEVYRDYRGLTIVAIRLQAGDRILRLELEHHEDPAQAASLDRDLLGAVRQAVIAAGATGLQLGGLLNVALTDREPNRLRYAAHYTPPPPDWTPDLPAPVFPGDPRLQAVYQKTPVRAEQRPGDVVWIHHATGCWCTARQVIAGWGFDDPRIVPAGTEVTDQALRELVAYGVRESYGAIGWASQPAEQAATWLDEPFIERGQFVSIYGPAGVGKSLLAQDRAAQLAAAGHRVLYLDAENPRAEVQARVAAMGHTPASLANLTYLSFPTLPPLDTPEGAARLATIVDAIAPELVVIDTWSKFLGGDEASPNTHTNAYNLSITPLRRAGVAVLAIDHAGKDASRGPRGGSSKVDNVDALWLVTAKGDSRLRLERRKSRTGRGPDLVELARRPDPLRHDRLDLTPRDVLTPEVRDCIARLDDSEVPIGWGRDRASELLRASGYRVRNETVAAAIKVRRERGVPPDLSPDHGDRSGQVPTSPPGTGWGQVTR